RLLTYRHAIRAHRFVPATQVDQSDPHVGVRGGVVRLQPDRVLVRQRRFGRPAQGIQLYAAVVVTFSADFQGRICSDDLLARAQGGGPVQGEAPEWGTISPSQIRDKVDNHR